jgi:single-stranded DNA-binding protein
MNCVSLTGVLAAVPKAVSDTQTPCCTARLCVTEAGKDGQIFKTWIPIECWGQAAISLSPLVEGTRLAVHGKLKWKSWLKDGQKQGSLIVSCFSLEVLSEASATHQEPDQATIDAG